MKKSLLARLAELLRKPVIQVGGFFVIRETVKDGDFTSEEISTLKSSGFLGREYNNGYCCYSWDLTSLACALAGVRLGWNYPNDKFGLDSSFVPE